MWQTPIYDRTQSDIDNKTSKGYLNIVDLNRIEGNIEYIANLMGVEVTTKKWEVTSIPYSTDFDRIMNNIKILQEKIIFYKYEAMPKNPINTFTKVNILERMIYRINRDWKLYTDNISLYCSETTYLSDFLI